MRKEYNTKKLKQKLKTYVHYFQSGEVMELKYKNKADLVEQAKHYGIIFK